MNITTTPLQAILYSLAFFMSVVVVSFNYAVVEQDRFGRDLIIAQYEQDTQYRIAVLAQESIISEHEQIIEGYHAVVNAWGCR